MKWFAIITLVVEAGIYFLIDMAQFAVEARYGELWDAEEEAEMKPHTFSKIMGIDEKRD